MRKIKEVLRLKFDVGLGLRQIARSCSIGLGTAHMAGKQIGAHFIELGSALLLALGEGFAAGRERGFLVLFVRGIDAVRTSMPFSPPSRNYSFELKITFCVRGVITAPCGEPTTVSSRIPSCITPAFNHNRISRATRGSRTHRCTSLIRIS